MDEPGEAPAKPPARRSALRVVLAVLGVGLLVAAGITVVGLVVHYTDMRTESIAGVREVVVDVDAGGVTLQAGSGSEVGLRTTRAWSWREPTAEHTIAGGVLTVTGRCPTFGIGCQVTEELTIPPGIAVRVTTSAGGVTATGLDVPGLTLASSAGGIEVRDVSAPRLDARSSAGGVSVSFLRPPDEVRAESSAGSVELTVPNGSYRVDAATSAGRVSVDVVQDPSAPRSLYAHSSAGDVTIRHR